MKYFSMFTGIGGFELGIQRAFDNEHAYLSEESESEERPQGRFGAADKQGLLLHDRNRTTPLCVGYSEIDKYAINTYEGHHEHRNYGDATAIDETGLPDFELLVGGFPCQAFSIAGKRHGFDDTRGTLFFDVARILKHKRPRHLVLENVKGLLSHEQGETFQTILGVLADLGYRVEYMVLNSKNFGVPQNRERVYIVGHLRDDCGGQIFPLRKLGMGTENPAVTLTARGYGSQRNGTYVATDPEEVKIRRLTPTECERLQGFPDGWTLGSDTQRYKQCGNAVTVNVVEAVMTALLHEGCLDGVAGQLATDLLQGDDLVEIAP
jgi:DNA (cytosine-5)-methyltransferase 1